MKVIPKIEYMNLQRLVKKILGVRGVSLAKSLSAYMAPERLSICINGKYFIVNPKRNYVFWKLVQMGKWESSTYTVLDKFLDKRHSCIDIGSWVGPTVLYASQLAKHCYAVEPDPAAFSELRNNIQLNKELISKITLSNLALGNSSGTIYLHQTDGEWGSSGSNILFDKTKASIQVKSITIQQFIQTNSITDCNFIKMDIEGGEFIVLPTMLEYLRTIKPTILLELHPMFIDNPVQKLKDMQNVLDIYDHIYDERLEKINLESIMFSFKNNSNKTLRIVLTSVS